MKQVAGSLRLDLAAYRELEAFAQLGTDLDAATTRQLTRGERMVELLKQPQYAPVDVIDQVIQIFAGGQGFLDDLEPTQVQPFATAMNKYFAESGKHVRDELEEKKALGDDLKAKLKEAIASFKSGWSDGDDKSDEDAAAGAYVSA